MVLISKNNFSLPSASPKRQKESNTSFEKKKKETSTRFTSSNGHSEAERERERERGEVVAFAKEGFVVTGQRKVVEDGPASRWEIYFQSSNATIRGKARAGFRAGLPGFVCCQKPRPRWDTCSRRERAALAHVANFLPTILTLPVLQPVAAAGYRGPKIPLDFTVARRRNNVDTGRVANPGCSTRRLDYTADLSGALSALSSPLGRRSDEEIEIYIPLASHHPPPVRGEKNSFVARWATIDSLSSLSLSFTLFSFHRKKLRVIRALPASAGERSHMLIYWDKDFCFLGLVRSWWYRPIVGEG